MNGRDICCTCCHLYTDDCGYCCTHEGDEFMPEGWEDGCVTECPYYEEDEEYEP
jgi:hypothetical protein